MKPGDLYKAAPRKSKKFTIGPHKVDLIEPSLKDRVEWSTLSEEHSDDSEFMFAFLVSRCCPQFKGESIESISTQLDPVVLMEIGNTILAMLDKKKG